MAVVDLDRKAVGEVLAGGMPETEVTVAYPGLWLRRDLYVTHGHYLDVHLTVPRIESIAASAMARFTGRRDSCESVADYEAAGFTTVEDGGQAVTMRRLFAQ